MAASAIYRALIFMAASALGQTAASKSSPTAAEQAAALSAIREYALSYTRSLPNYTCTQTTQQTVIPSATRGRTAFIEEQLSYVDHKEIHTVTKINGSRVSPGQRGQPAGTLSRGEFGNLLDTIFEPKSGADFQWDRLGTLNRRKVYVFAFHVPQPSGYALMDSKRTVRVPFKGFVYADYETRAVIRIEMKCIEIPAISEYKTADLTLDYKAARVAGQDYILPSHFVLHFRVAGGEVTNSAVYRSYRKFGADSTVRFDGGVTDAAGSAGVPGKR
jgi:hypothetical protein